MAEFSLRYFKDAADGSPLWFETMTGIGPQFTRDPAKACRFASFGQALASDAGRFSSAPTTIVEAPSLEVKRA